MNPYAAVKALAAGGELEELEKLICAEGLTQLDEAAVDALLADEEALKALGAALLARRAPRTTDDLTMVVDGAFHPVFAYASMYDTPEFWTVAPKAIEAYYSSLGVEADDVEKTIVSLLKARDLADGFWDDEVATWKILGFYSEEDGEVVEDNDEEEDEEVTEEDEEEGEESPDE